MRRISSHIKFFLCLSLIVVAFGGRRLNWIHKALPAQAEVLNIRIQRRLRIPVISYWIAGDSIKATGRPNLPVQIGDTIPILYNPDNVNDWMINQPKWLWYDLWDASKLVAFCVLLYFIIRFLVFRIDPGLRQRLQRSRSSSSAPPR